MCVVDAFWSGVCALPFLSPPVLAFSVLGSPAGFVSSGHRHRTKRTDRAWSWAVKVRAALTEAALSSGADARHSALFAPHPTAGLVLVATRDAPLFVACQAHFRTGTHPDPENCAKLAKDAAFHRSPGGDKHTAGAYDAPLYDRDNPRLEVRVFRIRRPAS